MKENKDVEIIGQSGATLSIIEIGLGSLLHAFHIPMSGVILSLNQGYLLCKASMKGGELPGSRWNAYSISNVAAALKSLSPAGKKLGPMLSLSMQGLLFNIATAIFGANLIGLCFGMIFLSVWTFIQPLITYYFFFGDKLISAVEFLYQKTLPYHHLESGNLVWIFALLVVAKMLIAALLAVVAWRRKDKPLYSKSYEEEFVRRAFEKMYGQQKNSKHTHPIIMALSDLLQPFFLISLGMTVFFLYFSNYTNWQIGQYILRPLAIGFIFFYISRTLTLERWLMRLESGRFRSFSLSCQLALSKLKKRS